MLSERCGVTSVKIFSKTSSARVSQQMQQKDEKRNEAANSITAHRNSRRKNQPGTHAPDPSAAVTSGGHYVSIYVYNRGSLICQIISIFRYALCVVRGLSICLTINRIQHRY